ncbi:hypothetical protein [Runella sp.]|jgi:hypothetical protein|uniref:hypothetical protein n=1 Tax=Runella sp. TaxID=1960881 RepID=UPI0026023FD3|nr:hypothetical protein [Runella sp.]
MSSPLTTPQLELLQMFSRPVDEADWIAIKQLITNYFGQKAIQEANKIWDEQQWNSDTVETLLSANLRTPYKK